MRWLALVLAYFLAFQWGIFPVSGAYSFSQQPAWTWEFAGSFLSHWFLPFLTLFLVGFGGWAIGMRNLIIYELESDYSNYLQALGAPSKLVRRYAYQNAVLPQMSGLALALGAVLVNCAQLALVSEAVNLYLPAHLDARQRLLCIFVVEHAVLALRLVLPAFLPPTPTSVRVRSGEAIVTDGPYAEVKESLGGYYLFSCESMEDAIAWAAKIPSASHGGAIEVRPVHVDEEVAA